MSDKLLPIKIPPGIYRNGTKYQSRGFWYEAQLIRFIENTIKPVGGWRRARIDSGADLAALDGKPRAAVAWRTDKGDTLVAFATTTKLYVFAGGVLRDITPAGFVAGGANTAPTTSGGTYGAGAYGTGTYGQGATAATIIPAATWQLDVFGSSLVAVCTSNKKLYVWNGDLATIPAVPAGAPASVAGVVVTPERFLIALGVDGNTRRVSWPSQESTTEWDLTIPGSTAGFFDITSDGELVCGRRTKAETLLWTTTDLHSMQYIGGIFLYRFVLMGEKCGIVSPRAAVTFDTKAMWMGRSNFFVYDGFVQPVPCSLHDYVFGDFNQMQSIKVWSTTIAEFGEVWWFYPSAASDECDRYVVFNYRENHWNMGKLRRAAGFDAGVLPSPVFAAPSGEVFEHEVVGGLRPAVAGEAGGFYLLTEDGAVVLLETAGAMLGESTHPYLESGPIELGDGDRLMNVQRIIPDDKTLGDVVATFYGALFPDGVETVRGPYLLKAQTNTRFKARQSRIRIDELGGSDWRVGEIRLGVRESERR